MNTKTKKVAAPAVSQWQTMLIKEETVKVPQVGDIVAGRIVSIKGNVVRIDIPGFAIGLVRGKELVDESEQYTNLKVGDEVEATVIDLENEEGVLELSFRHVGHQKAWDQLKQLQKSGEIITVIVTDANRGGLLIKYGRLAGFLPVSQLASEHYPRLDGDAKNKLLEKLKQFVGQSLQVKITGVDETQANFIVSEKAAWLAEQEKTLSAYKPGDIVEGAISGLTDFGAFLKFDTLEGLIHISELSWQRIDHPRQVVKPNDRVKAQIISIDGPKIFLSLRRLQTDPWQEKVKKYQVGQTVEGKVAKIHPYGLLVELEPEVWGLAHVSELSDKPFDSVDVIAKIGDCLSFKIITIEPSEHRIGLSLKATAQEEKPEEEQKEGK